MPSSSTLSDVDPARVLAREQHHDLQRPSTPPPKVRQDSTVLSLIGSHLNNTPEPESWPSSIENLTEDEMSSPSTLPTPRGLDATSQNETGIDDNTFEDEPLTSLMRTQMVDVTYLPRAQYRLFYRQHTREQTMRDIGERSSEPSPTRLPASNINAIEYRTRQGEAPERTHHVQVAFSVSHTAPPMSVYTVEEDVHVSVQVPGPDDPWSSVNTTLEYRRPEEQETSYTIPRGHRRQKQTPKL